MNSITDQCEPNPAVNMPIQLLELRVCLVKVTRGIRRVARPAQVLHRQPLDDLNKKVGLSARRTTHHELTFRFVFSSAVSATCTGGSPNTSPSLSFSLPFPFVCAGSAGTLNSTPAPVPSRTSLPRSATAPTVFCRFRGASLFPLALRLSSPPRVRAKSAGGRRGIGSSGRGPRGCAGGGRGAMRATCSRMLRELGSSTLDPSMCSA